MNRLEAVNFLKNHPYKFGHMVGFDKLTELHNSWIKDMIIGKEDSTLQAHRNSYKTTCLSIAISLIMVLLPKDRILFMRKTDDDVKEIIKQVKKILESQYMKYFVRCIYNVNFFLSASNMGEITTNLVPDIRGTSQLVGIGTMGSLTGKHFDKIFTDDIVNLKDRISKAERDRTKSIYQELQNIKNRGGRIYNTGTPWHKDDAFTIMPTAKKIDCYSSGLLSKEEIEYIKGQMSSSLFAANYELKHIAEEDIFFDNPEIVADPSLAEQGECHIDAAYGGGDYTAFTICRKFDNKYYVYGRCWQKNVDDVMDEIIRLRKEFNAGRIHCETNADKGYLGKELRKIGERTVLYHENMNKFIKITTYLKAEWKNVIFVAGTDDEYINMICDFNENAEHDDCPDSLASLIRILRKRKGTDSRERYKPVFTVGIGG